MPTHAALGQISPCPHAYDASLLEPVPRHLGRAPLGLNTLPFTGVDLWTAYEVSWLAPSGKPEVAVAEFRIPASSPAIIESKSFKLYLNSLNELVLADVAALQALLQRDLSAVAGAAVTASLRLPSQFAGASAELPGTCIDMADVGTWAPTRGVEPGHLHASAGADVQARLTSQLFRSICPVTGQPDWASLQLHYAGPRLDEAGLLRYLLSYRQHPGFHEQCVERIFCDVMHSCRPRQLTVYARFTRRGGLDINPFRSNFETAPESGIRTHRQ